MTRKAQTRNFGNVIRAKLAANPELAEAVKEEAFNADLAQKIYRLRTQAGLTQKQLAALVGTQQSVISRIEDADYDGHSLTILKRIAAALKRRLKVEFCAEPQVGKVVVKAFDLDWQTSQYKWEPKLEVHAPTLEVCTPLQPGTAITWERLMPPLQTGMALINP